MVHAVQTSAAERALNRATSWIPAPLRSYAVALAALIFLSAVAYPLVHGAPRGSMGLLGLVIALLYLLVLLGRASPLGKLWETIFGSPLVFSNTAKFKPGSNH